MASNGSRVSRGLEEELFEGAAKRKSLFTDQTIDDIRFRRIMTIHKKLQEHKPKLVVMYGSSEKKKEPFERLAGRSLEAWDVFGKGETLMTLMPHPTSHGVTNQRWVEHAIRLRKSRS